MPSLYEPFGMANEYYLKGLAVVGRATGGIVQQVVPLRSCGAFSDAVAKRTTAWYDSASHPTGILFREPDDIPSAVEDWKMINAAAYTTDGTGANRLQQRGELPLVAAMARELRLGIEDAVRLVEETPHLYYEMVIDGALHTQRTFSWLRNANDYARMIRRIYRAEPA